MIYDVRMYVVNVELDFKHMQNAHNILVFEFSMHYLIPITVGENYEYLFA